MDDFRDHSPHDTNKSRHHFKKKNTDADLLPISLSAEKRQADILLRFSSLRTLRKVNFLHL